MIILLANKYTDAGAAYSSNELRIPPLRTWDDFHHALYEIHAQLRRWRNERKVLTDAIESWVKAATIMAFSEDTKGDISQRCDG